MELTDTANQSQGSRQTGFRFGSLTEDSRMSIGRATIAIFGFLAIACRLWSSQHPAGVRTGIPDFFVASNQEGIPFHFSREFGLILIRAEVNGGPALFVLDTG